MFSANMTNNTDYKAVDGSFKVFRPVFLFVMAYRKVDYRDDTQYQRWGESGDHGHADEDNHYGHKGHCNNRCKPQHRYWPNKASQVISNLQVGTSTVLCK